MRITALVSSSEVLHISGVHRPPVGEGRNGAKSAQSWTGGGGGGYVIPPQLGVSRFAILSRFFVMLSWFFYFASCLSITAKLISPL